MWDRVAADPVGRIADGGEQLVGSPLDWAGVDRIIQCERDRVDAERESRRQGRGVGVGRVAGDRIVAVGEVDDVEDGGARLRSLVRDDLVARVVQVEACQRDDCAGGDRGRRRVGHRAFAGPEAAGGQPAVVGEIDGGADLDRTQEDERERVRAGTVVVDDGNVAGGENGGHDSLLSVGSGLCRRRAESLRAARQASGTVFSGIDRSREPTLRWAGMTLRNRVPQVYWT